MTRLPYWLRLTIGVCLVPLAMVWDWLRPPFRRSGQGDSWADEGDDT